MSNSSDSVGSVPYFQKAQSQNTDCNQEPLPAGLPNGFNGIQRIPVENSLNQSSNNPKREITEGYKIFTFLVCVIAIYSFQIVNALIEERIYKVPYKRNGSNLTDMYTDAITPMLFVNIFAIIIGYLKLDEEELNMEISSKKLLKVAVLSVAIHLCLIVGMMKASYILMIMANTCGLLSIILVGIYFSRNPSRPRAQEGQEEPVNRQQSMSLGYDKIWICLIVCSGMLIFNLSAPKKEGHQSQTEEAHHVSIVAVVLLLIAVFLQGLKPEYLTRIKQEYSPSPIGFYFHFNKVEFFVTLACSLVSFQLPYTVKFALNHDQLLLHIVLMSLFNSISALFIYKIIALFRQHIYPLVGTVRKCLSVGFSALYFGHHLSGMQIVGVGLVFGGVLLQIMLNYKICQKYDIELPFVEQERNQKYVKSYQKNQGEAPRKKYEIYRILQEENDGVQGI